MSCARMRMGIGNDVQNATLTSTPEPVTPLEYLSNELRARQVKYEGLETDSIVIEGSLDEQSAAGFFAIPGCNLIPGATVKLELFEDLVSEVDVLEMEEVTVSTHKPVGLWEVGVDVYGDLGATTFDNVIVYWFDRSIVYQRFKLTVEHAILTGGAEVPNSIPLQDGSGIVSIEAESGEITNNSGSNVWTETSDIDASGGQTMIRSGPRYYNGVKVAPSLTYQFTASRSGSHDVWLRVRTYTGERSVFVVFDEHRAACLFDIDSDFTWQKARKINIKDGRTHTLTIAARATGFDVDKIVIKPEGESAPTGTGPATSGFGVVDADEFVLMRMLIIGRQVELEKNFSRNPQMRFTTEPENVTAYSGFRVPIRAQENVRQMTLSLEHMTKNDFMTLVDIETTLAGRPFLFSAYPDADEWTAQSHTFLARFENSLSYSRALESQHKTALTISET